jgi:polyhydroxybutyrate depolymerase
VTTYPNPATVSAPTTAANPTEGAATPATSDEIVVGGERSVTVRLPVDDASTPAALLVMLHGLGSSGAEHEAYFRFGPAAARHGFVYAHPDGTVDSQGNHFWNATDACCDFDATGVDDAAYLGDLITEISARASIDMKRVYIVGHSNGGFMSYRMACEHADLVAAIVSLAGATYATRTDCRPSEPVAILEIHGTADDIVRFDGGSLSDIGAPGTMSSYPGARETAATWTAYDGCTVKLAGSKTTVDVDAGIFGPTGPAETTVETATECDPGGHVELWTIPNGGHGPNLSATFADSVMDFLLAHPKP